MQKLRVLYDTNIIIKREDPNILSDSFIELNRIINDLNYKILVHPLSIEDINRDKDEIRRNISLSKLGTYSEIKRYPTYNDDIEFKAIVGNEVKANDRVDNSLIYAVYKNAADILITEDKGILTKAESLNIKEKILNISEAILHFSNLLPPQDTSILPCFQILKGWNINLEDSIFDTLKNEYSDFEEWWRNTVCRTERDIFVYKDKQNGQDKIKAILIIKEEDQEVLDSEPQKILNDVLKICLFKVDESTRGMKLGERLLKMAFEQALIKKKQKLYLTHFSDKKGDKLVSLIETFGFYLLTKKKNNEDVFYKEINPQQEIIITTREQAKNNNQKYFPSFYDGEQVSKFIIPIQPQFFKRLFPDYKVEEQNSFSQLSLDLDLNNQNQYSSEGFSIQKAYLCNTPIRLMQEGDIILFYRTEDYKAILTLGTIEGIYYNINDPDKIYKLIKRRTVYSEDEIKQMCQRRNPPVVILFKHNCNLKKEVTWQYLAQNHIVNGIIQTVRHLENQKSYKDIIKEGQIDESLIINKTQIC